MQQNNLYTQKESGYYGNVREDVLALVPADTVTLLDVGCGAGATGAAAKQRLGPHCQVTGIEFYQEAADVARRMLDRVIVGDIEQLTLDFPADYFDCILCADVLEHTRDPWNVLTRLRSHLKPGGCLIASLPNLRHIGPILKIIINRLEYEESGILDKTHLRFFTFHTIRLMFEETGYTIEHITPKRSTSWKFMLLNLFSLGVLRPFSIYQYVLVARKQ